MSSPESIDAPTLSSSDAAENGANVTNGSSELSPSTSNQPSSSNFPPPKTDKPRPHVCSTCLRSFARLEHLKRHERSHTKEKPFECPECTRCFARRDLLLRHQQKLHSSSTPSSRPRTGRRESAAGVAAGRVRKNSVANNGTSGMRPRANTLSHIDAGTLSLANNVSPVFARNFAPGHSHHNSFGGMSSAPGYQYRGMTTGNVAAMTGLPKLETGLPMDLSGGLRTAPPFGGFGAEFAMSNLAYASANANTINPHALHFHGMQGLGIDASGSPYAQYFGNAQGQQHLGTDDENHFDWMTQGFENQMTFGQATENAIDDSSPSAMSTNSPAGVSELMLDGSNSTAHHMPSSSSTGRQGSTTHQNQMVNSPMNMEFVPGAFNEVLSAQTGTLSPKSLLAQNGSGLDMNFATPPDMSTIDPSSMAADFGGPPFQLPYSKHGAASTSSTSSMDSSLRQSSITTASSSELVNENVRNLLIAALTQSVGFGQRKYPQPSVSSPLSPGNGARNKSFNVNNFPSTQDLQRYVAAYIQYFHPHLPFLHVPTLSFESLDYTTTARAAAGSPQYGQVSATAGGSCLVLSVAAVGALYEHELGVSRELFEYGKRLIGSFLEERRKSNMTRTQFGANGYAEIEDTPLWLVQAMLLNVIYGHNCGDKTAADIASNHCVTLVSLARGAELARPPPPPYPYMNTMGNSTQKQGVPMQGMLSNGWHSLVVEPDDSEWRSWKVVEERKRTLYAVFILSSLLVSAYNHPPALTNSEIRLDLPCDEDLWAAESSQAWRAVGGAAQADSKAVTFSAALGHLLTAAQRQQHKNNHASQHLGSASAVSPDAGSELRPSTFGCLVLINALHNYIWETRQRHLGRQWTAQETEQMHAHIEPALRAWQAAWASNPSHSLERPNPFGVGPLSADSIPLLDLAYVRLFVNLGRSKDAFWQRDYDAMAEELARGPDASQATESPPYGNGNGSVSSHNQRRSSNGTMPADNLGLVRRSSGTMIAGEQTLAEPSSEGSERPVVPSTRRERHFRKAAFYAADSLSMADKLGSTFADRTCRELPSQSAMCAFDCAQVLAEWVTIVQERVGKYLGILGQDDMDLLQIPGILLLEDEDRRLLEKIGVVLESAEQKMHASSSTVSGNHGGYASKILVLTAHMLDKAAVWPVTKLMARSLETQAVHMRDRAQKSIITRV